MSWPHTSGRPGGANTPTAGSHTAESFHIAGLVVTKTIDAETGGPKIDESHRTNFATCATQCWAVSTRFGAMSVPEQVRTTWPPSFETTSPTTAESEPSP